MTIRSAAHAHMHAFVAVPRGAPPHVVREAYPLPMVVRRQTKQILRQRHSRCRGLASALASVTLASSALATTAPVIFIRLLFLGWLRVLNHLFSIPLAPRA